VPLRRSAKLAQIARGDRRGRPRHRVLYEDRL